MRDDFRFGEINYVIFQIKDDDLKEIPVIMKKAITIVLENDGNVGNILSSFVIIFYGILFFNDNDKKVFGYKYKELAQELVDKLKFDIKVAYGNTYAAVGNIGSDYSQSYGPIIPHLSKIIKLLSENDFGEMVEVE